MHNFIDGFSKKQEMLLFDALGVAVCGITSYYCFKNAHQRFFQSTASQDETLKKSKFLNYTAAAGYAYAGTISGIATIACAAHAILVSKVLKE